MKSIQQLAICLLVTIVYMEATSRHGSHLQKLLKYPGKASKKTILTERPVSKFTGTKYLQDDMVVRDDSPHYNEKAAAKGLIAKSKEKSPCTDAACDAVGDVDTSNWAILNKTNKTDENKKYISEDTPTTEGVSTNEGNKTVSTEGVSTNEGNKTVSTVPKKKLQDIFSSVDSTTKSEQVQVSKPATGTNTNDEEINTTKKNNTISHIVAEEAAKNDEDTADKKTIPLMHSNVNKTEADNETECTDAACMASPPSNADNEEKITDNEEKSKNKENSTVTGEKVNQTTVEEQEKEAATDEEESIPAAKEKSNQTISKEEDETETKENEGPKEKESVKTYNGNKTTNEENVKTKEEKKKVNAELNEVNEDTQNADQKTNNIMDKIAESVTQHENDTQAKSNCTDASCMAAKDATNGDDNTEETTSVDKEKKKNETSFSKTVDEEANKENSTNESEQDKEITKANNKKEDQCTDASCSVAESEESESIELKKESEAEDKQKEDNNQVKSECTDAACMAGKESEEKQEDKLETSAIAGKKTEEKEGDKQETSAIAEKETEEKGVKESEGEEEKETKDKVKEVKEKEMKEKDKVQEVEGEEKEAKGKDNVQEAEEGEENTVKGKDKIHEDADEEGKLKGKDKVQESENEESKDKGKDKVKEDADEESKLKGKDKVQEATDEEGTLKVEESEGEESKVNGKDHAPKTSFENQDKEVNGKEESESEGETKKKKETSVQESESECTDAACSAGLKPEVKPDSKEKEAVQNEKETEEANEAEMKAIAEDSEMSIVNTNNSISNTNNTVTNFKHDLDKAVNATVTDDISKSECTDAACTAGPKPESSNKTESVIKNLNENKTSTDELDTETAEAVKEKLADLQKVQLKKKKNGKATHKEKVSSHIRNKSKCADASCSSYLKQKKEEYKAAKLVSTKKKNGTGHLLPTTTEVHSDDLDTVFDNGTAEFLSEILPKVSNVKDMDEAAKHKPEDKDNTKHETDTESEAKATCSDAACDRSGIEEGSESVEKEENATEFTKTSHKTTKNKSLLAKKRSRVRNNGKLVYKISD